jgi:hypothetical protein
MNKTKGKQPDDDFKVEVLSDSIKFYLPRVEGISRLYETWLPNIEGCH